MSTGVRHLDRFTSTSDDLGPWLPGPPSSAPLLRADEGDRPAAGSPIPLRPPVDPVALLVADARTLLLAADDDAVSDRWQDERFVGQVEAARRHLAPIEDPELIAASFTREAFHGPRLARVPAVAASPVRVAYAIRWMELQVGLALPGFRCWFP
jgi:hypothetical protein